MAYINALHCLCLVHLFVIFMECEKSTGLVIIPEDREDSDPHTYCLGSEESLFIDDPFPPNQAEDSGDYKFIAQTWFKITKHEEIQATIYSRPGHWNIDDPKKYATYKFWGLEIKNVNLNDTALYKAKQASSNSASRYANIVVATAPQLRTQTLEVSRRTVDEVTVEVTCGRLISLGQPPARLILMAANGTVLLANYTNGYVKAKISTELADLGPVSCELDSTSAAAQCVPAADSDKWVAHTSADPSTAASAGDLDLLS